MTQDGREQIVKAIHRYLDHHFPGTEINQNHDAMTGNLTFHLYAGDTHYRLTVTESYLEGDQGTEIPTQQLTDWQVAQLLLDAEEDIVTLDTSGARITPSDPAGGTLDS